MEKEIIKSGMKKDVFVLFVLILKFGMNLVGLGYFKDNIGALMKATKYLSGEDLPPEGGQ